MNEYSTVIIGGGVSGLTCARYLNDKGMSFVILESSDALGGRRELKAYLKNKPPEYHLNSSHT